ncbi:MAG TPA: hypothetical protein VF701_22620 [Thermoanaerobaculia bacterium]
MFRFTVDPKIIYAERVKGRHVIYLDTNAWSDLSERRSDAAIRAYAAAVRAHTDGLTIFPLSYATITELLKRDVNADSLQQSDLMDLLSRGVTLRGDPHVRDLEVLCAFEYMTRGISMPPTAEMFTVIACYIADREIPAVGVSDRLGVMRVAYPTVRWLQQRMRTPELLEHETRTDEEYVRKISQKINDVPNWATDGSGKPNAKKLRFEEHTAAFNSYIMGNLARLVGLQGMQLLHERLPSIVRKPGGPAAVAPVIAAMPSISLSCEMSVQKMLSRTRTRKQDFYDHEHAARAIPYVDAFVTADTGLLDILRRAKVPSTHRCRILNGIAALADYLEVLTNP